MGTYWIGSVGKAVFVFDPDIQPTDSAEVTLFSFNHDKPVKLVKSAIRARIVRGCSEDLVEDVLKRYRNWKQFYRSELEAINQSQVFDTPKFLASAQTSGIRANWGRQVNCYQCGSALQGKRGNICDTCFWIKCSCGACGCGWRR